MKLLFGLINFPLKSKCMQMYDENFCYLFFKQNLPADLTLPNFIVLNPTVFNLYLKRRFSWECDNL